MTFKPTIEEIVCIVEQAAVLTESEIATGIAQHPTTKRWQTWVSLYGTNVVHVTAHYKRDDADQVARDIASAWKEGKLKTQDEVTAFLKSLPSDNLVTPCLRGLS